MTKHFYAVRKAVPRAASEEALHRTVVQWLNLKIGDRCLWHHCPNGGARSKSTAGRLKAMGVRPGVADEAFHREQIAALEQQVPGLGGVDSPGDEGEGGR